MPELFTVEEINLMYIFDMSSRNRLIADIINAVGDFEDEMLEIAEPLLEKLQSMSDADFTAFEFYPEYTDYEEKEE